MPSQQMFLGLGGASGGGDIATLHGVSSSASTVVSLRKSDDVCCTNSQPSSSGWGDFPYISNTGLFISGFWSTTEVHKGFWKTGGTSPYNTPAGLTSPSSASMTNPYPGYSISDSIGSGASNSATGAFAYYGAGNARIDGEIMNYTFSGGLGAAVGFVIQAYGNSAANSGPYHNTPMVKITINSVTRIYAAKGHIGLNSTTAAGTGASGFVVYPMNSNYTNWLNGSAWSGISGTQLASSYFEY